MTTPTIFDFLDKAHAPYAFVNAAHDAYAPGPHHSSISSLNGVWETSGHATVPHANSIPRSRSNPSTTSYSTPNTSYNVDPYTPSHYASHQDSHVSSHIRPQNAYHHPMANTQSRSNQDIIHSMLTPLLPDMSTRSPNRTTSATNHERVSWERSGLQSLNVPSSLQGLRSDCGPDSFHWSPNSDTQFMNFDAQIWDDALSPPMTASNMHSYVPSQGYSFTPEISPVPSPPPYSSPISCYPSPDAKRQVSPASSSSSRPESRRGSLDSSGGGKSCSHCHATSTPLWRREPTTLKPLCNACGLYYLQRNKHRPQELIDADAADDSSEESEGDGNGPECSHCRTHRTSVWRRSKTGAQLCNACGVYSRLRGRDRPLSLKRNKIKPRSKHTPTPK